MDQELLREFDCLRNDIVPKLRSHAFVDNLSARHVIQYLVLPSCTPPVAWDVFRRGRKVIRMSSFSSEAPGELTWT